MSKKAAEENNEDEDNDEVMIELYVDMTDN